MAKDQDLRSGRVGDRAAGAGPVAAGAYRPSSALRRALRRSATDQARPESRWRPTRLTGSPSPTSLLGAAIVAGAASGFLELAVLMVQIHGLHRVGLSSLKISRHVAWMVPAAETVATLLLATALIGPALAWSAWKRRRGGDPAGGAWIWRWSRLVLGTLLFLGPLLAVRRLHGLAALALSLGAGSRVARGLIRPTAEWSRGARWAGAIATAALVLFSSREYERVANAESLAWSRPASEAPNLLWIVMDTVRADHMSLFGYGRPTTPHLDRWAREGLTFTRARSAAPWTLPSHVTMFTGLWPYQHGARIDRPYHGASPTIAEHLADAGYATAGLAGNTGMCNAVYGVGRGFDYYVELVANHEVSIRASAFSATLPSRLMAAGHAIGLPVPGAMPQAHRRLAPELIGHAGEWLGRVEERNRSGSPRPFFLFMNFMDVHSPYVPLAGSTRKFWTSELPERKQSVPEVGWKALHARDDAPADRKAAMQAKLDATTGQLIDLYDDCLLGLDAELGRFLDDLRDSGRLDRTWVVITSDHGEEFGEHGIFGHGASLYSQVTQVPLILIPPISERGKAGDAYASLRSRRIDVPVSLRDLPSTMTELLLPGRSNPFPGRSLSRYWTSDAPADPILAQMQEQHFAGEEVQMDNRVQMDSVVLDGHLLIEPVAKPSELYDILGDPENRRNLASRPDEAERQEYLKRALDELRGGS